MPQTLAWPISRNADGSYAAVDQGSPQELRQAVAIVLSVPVRSLVDLPAFGRAEQAFRPGGANVAQLRAAISRWEPRAPTELVDDGIVAHAQTIDVTVSPS